MRKHSRRAEKKKKKKNGKSANRYILESQVLEHLQLSIERFSLIRRCKGISPKKPKKNFKGYNPYLLYYRVKDINSLMPSKPLPKKIKHPQPPDQAGKRALALYYARMTTIVDSFEKKRCGELECGNPVRKEEDPSQQL